MGGSVTFSDSQGSYSTIAFDISTVKIKALFYFSGTPALSANAGDLRIDGLYQDPHLIHFRNDTSFEDFKQIVRSLPPASRCLTLIGEFRYYLPGHGMIALSTEEDMKHMIEEFDELNRIQGPQIYKIFKCR